MPLLDPTLSAPPGACDFVAEYVREGLLRGKRLIGWTFFLANENGDYTWMASGGKFVGGHHSGASFPVRNRAAAQLRRAYADPAKLGYTPEDFS